MAERVLPGDFREFLKLLNETGVEYLLIYLSHLRANKRAAGRHKDLDDLEHLPKTVAGQKIGPKRRLRELRGKIAWKGNLEKMRRD